jgi:hypothetical protein
VLSLGLCFSILTIPVQALSSGHASQSHHLFSVLHGNQQICFSPTYRPQERWLAIWSVHHYGNLVSRSQAFSPDKPVSMPFDACVAIDKGRCGDTGCGCGGRAWERACMSNGKCMCRGDNSRPCDDVGSYYCPYWVCVSWATWQRAEYAALLHKGTAAPTAPMAPGTL